LQELEGFGIDIDQVSLNIGSLQQKVRQDAHSGPNLQYMVITACQLQTTHYLAGYVFIRQKMLTQMLFCPYQ
jgi:hypothetical protein